MYVWWKFQVKEIDFLLDKEEEEEEGEIFFIIGKVFIFEKGIFFKFSKLVFSYIFENLCCELLYVY